MTDGKKPKSKKIAKNISRLPPCNSICPAGENIQHWISLAKDKKFYEAWRTIVEKNPFPAIHGRICYHYCETRCNRVQYDSTVGIHCIERFLGDMALAQNWELPLFKEEIKKKVLVVGAGPAGLSAAYYLRLKGYDVTIYEALAKPGGTMFTGIPAYRLPREVLSGEINRILNTGVKIEYNRRVDDILMEKEQGEFDAVFLAIGAYLGKNVAFPMTDPCRIFYAVDYLRNVAFDNPPDLGSKVAIYGGGNTAIDVARTARRLGVLDVSIIYHRTKEKMSAFPHEIEEAIEEGVKFIFLRGILGINKNKLMLNVNELDKNGRPQQTSNTEEIDIDSFVFALGQIPSSEFLRKVPEIEVQPTGVVTVDQYFMTGCTAVFAGGDMIPLDRSVTISTGHGRKAANYIDAYIKDIAFSAHHKPELATFDKLHIESEKSAKTTQEILDPDIRIKSFDEVLLGCNQDEILYEADRCFSCGNCFGCGKCYTACPVQVIAHSEETRKVTGIDGENCIGCGKCFKVCPCGAITMIDR